MCFLVFRKQTFLRQKATISSSVAASMQSREGKVDHNNKMADNAMLASQRGEDKVVSKNIMETNGINTEHKWESLKNGNENRRESSDMVDFIHNGDASEQIFDNQKKDSASVGVENRYERPDQKDGCWVENFCATDKKLLHVCSKVNENTAGALRYALHLRFLCPFPKKSSRSSRKSKSDSLSAQNKPHLDIDGERKFYLYNDMRVVFPQRHSDSDEGKVMVVFSL